MSKEDPKEHLKTYEKFCAPRFKGLEEAVHSIDVTVNNGLVESVKRIESAQRWLVRLLVGILVTVALASVGLYWQTSRKIEDYLLRSIGATEAVSDDYREVPDAE